MVSSLLEMRIVGVWPEIGNIDGIAEPMFYSMGLTVI